MRIKAIVYILFIPALYYAVYAVLFYIRFKKMPLVYYIQNELTIDPDQNTLTFRNFDHKKKYDVVFLGSSHAYRNFDTRLFARYGWDTYNLGSTNQSPLNSWYLLKELKQMPRKIVLEVYPEASNNSGKEGFFYLNKNVPDYRPLLGMCWSLKDLRCLNLLSIKPFITWHHRRERINIPNYKGYISTPDSATAEILYDKYVMDEAFLEKQLGYIEKIARKCREYNTTLLLVYAPVPPALYIQGETAYIQKINMLASRYRIPFAHFGRNHQFNPLHHFYDDDHLNQTGVTIFNTDLIHKYFLNSPHE